MWFEACPTRRNGQLIPGWQKSSSVRVGELLVNEERDPDLHRMVRTAHLKLRGVDAVPPLRDVVLISAGGDVVSLTGFERVDSLGAAATFFQQSWVLHAITSEQAQVWLESRALHHPAK